MPAAIEVRRMFGAIAGRYDLLNRILSLGTDMAWRERACEVLEVARGERAIDLCCGTGDLSLALARRGARVIGADFSHEMLVIAAGKGAGTAGGLVEADCLALPFSDGAFRVATVAFGVRNLSDLEKGLREIRRVLEPGGRLGILEFATPPGPLFRSIYRIYLRWAVPVVGALVSGRRSAYDYLSSSIQSFPDQTRMETILRGIGFTSVRHVDLARGIAALYIGYR